MVAVLIIVVVVATLGWLAIRSDRRERQRLMDRRGKPGPPPPPAHGGPPMAERALGGLSGPTGLVAVSPRMRILRARREQHHPLPGHGSGRGNGKR